MTRFLCFSFLLFCLPGLAQNPEPDEEGCEDSKLLTRMPRCRISECARKEFDSAELIVGTKGEEFLRKDLSGVVETISYECAGNISTVQIAQNMEAALRKAGYRIVYLGKKWEEPHPIIAAQNGAQWIEVRTWMGGDTPSYKQTAVKVQQMAQEVEASADAWAAEIEKSGHVAVYGINFDTGKSAIKTESEKPLLEIVSLMKSHADWKLCVEGHTDNAGSKVLNQTLSQQRAAAVVQWLVAHGVSSSNLVAQGFGDAKPVAGNDTDEGRAKNRRVELAKL